MGIFVTSVSPNSLLTGQSKEITLAGFGFEGNIVVLIFGKRIPAFFASDTIVKFVLPYLPQGQYDINVVSGDGSSWIARQALTITDAPNGALGILGSVELPIVLPPIIIDSACTAHVNPAAQWRQYASPARVYSDTTTGDVTAYLTPDASYVPSEPVNAPDSQPTPSTGTILVTPWGTFTNE